jgi:hypothetical protein
MPFIRRGTARRNDTLGGIDDLYNSQNVYINHVPVALYQDPQDAEAVVAAQVASPTYAVDNAVTETIEGETDSKNITDAQRKLVEAGLMSQAELDRATKFVTTTSNTTLPSPQAGDTSGSVVVLSNVDDTVLYTTTATSTTLPDITYKVRTVTKQVTFPYDVATVAPKNGITVAAVCQNLSHLIKNCFHPIKVQYPDAFLTCSFRARGSNPTSQHPLGMACDIQYSNISRAEYYSRALWIKNNIPFDQFLLEYQTTPKKTVWHHLSFKAGGNRGQVFTLINHAAYKGWSTQGLFDLTSLVS